MVGGWAPYKASPAWLPTPAVEARTASASSEGDFQQERSHHAFSFGCRSIPLGVESQHWPNAAQAHPPRRRGDTTLVDQAGHPADLRPSGRLQVF